MTWDEFCLARRMLREETVGKWTRQKQVEEDAEYEATIAAMRRDGVGAR